MYIRFTTPGTVTRAGIAPGLFRAAYPLASRYGDEPLGQALWWEIGWFEQNLPVPRGHQPFAVRSKRRWHKDGVCWFRDDARDMLRHAHVMAVLIEDCGVPVTRQVAEHPGQILYRDAWQVVAKPDNHRRRCPWAFSLGGVHRRRRRFVFCNPSKRRPSCPARFIPTRSRPFERTSKRRKGYPSETRVKRGVRTIKGGAIELLEKLGRNDPCPCGSGRRFQGLLPALGPVSTARSGATIGAR